MKLKDQKLTFFKIGIFLSVLFLNHSVFSKNITLIEGNEKIVSINKIDLFEDEDGKKNIRNLLNEKFIESQLAVPNLKVTKSVTWARFSLESKKINSPYLIQIEYPLLTEVTLYYINNNIVIDSVEISTQKPFNVRNYKNQFFLFDSKLNQYDKLTYYVKFISNNQGLLPIRVGKEKKILEEALTRYLISGLYFGIILTLVLYNLFVFFIIRDREYIYYVLYILFVGLTQAIINGYAFKYLWPNNMWLSSHALSIVGALSGIFMALFVIDFLRLKVFLKKAVTIYSVFIFIYCLSILASILDFQHISYRITDICAGLITFFTFCVGLIILKKKYKPAKFFIVAWTIFLVGVFVFVLRNLGILPYNNYTNYTMPLGSAIEGVLLSLALADKINILKKEKEASQLEALEMAQKNETIIRQQNTILEQKVKERTVELSESNNELNSTLKNLKDTQTQLLNSEKMASLGQLTAGIAHEINNPINFVTSNINPLRRDLEDILNVLASYENIKSPENLEQHLNEIQQLKKELDLEFVKEEINILIDGINEGANRTSEIVQGLKSFSRLDQDNLKTCHINEAIDSTLTLLNNKIKDNMEVVREYIANGAIMCYPGKVNQLLMNLITNSIQAIESNKNLKPEEGKIIVNSYEDETHLFVKIKDNGMGMDKETQQKMFDPFFTTKDVGQGTGLGMSIAYNIVEAHKGKIYVTSESGVGTEIIVSLSKEL